MSFGHRRTAAGGVGIERTLPAGRRQVEQTIALCNPIVPISGLFVRLPPEILSTGPRSDNLRPIAALVEEIDRASSPHRATPHRSDPDDPVGVTGRGGRPVPSGPERVASRASRTTGSALDCPVCAQTHARCRSRHTPHQVAAHVNSGLALVEDRCVVARRSHRRTAVPIRGPIQARPPSMPEVENDHVQPHRLRRRSSGCHGRVAARCTAATPVCGPGSRTASPAC